jgi:predicted amidophosphoribosyltransferase
VDEITLRWLMLGLAILVMVALKIIFDRWSDKDKVDTCPQCNGHIPKKTYRCPRCGWSQDTADDGRPKRRIGGPF